MKKIMILVSVVVMLFAFTAPTLSAATLDKSILPADTKWVIHADMDAFNGTWLKKYIMNGEHGKEYNKMKNSEFAQLQLDPMKDIANVTVFGTSTTQKDFVVVANGNFKPKFILEKLATVKSYKTEKYGKYKLHKWEDGVGVFVGNHTLVYSKTMEAVKKALAGLKGKSRLGTKLSKYLGMIPRNALVLAAATNVSDMAPGAGGQHAMLLKKTGVATFMAMESNKNLTAKVMLNTDSEETSTQIESIARGLLALVSMQGGEEMGKAAEMLNKLKIARKGSTLEASFSYPSEELVKMMEESAKKKHRKHKKHKHKDHKKH